MEKVYYSAFGAKGDGVTDDFDAIIAAHAYANEHDLPVKADEGATYYIGAAAKTAVISTDTDWTGAKFIIDDRAINYNGHPAQHSSLFVIPATLARFPLEVKSLTKGASHLGAVPGEKVLVYIEDAHNRHFIRYGANANAGAAQQEMLLVDAEGNIDPTTPPAWEYKDVTECYAIPTSEKPITVQGGAFHTLANEIDCDRYLSTDRNIKISRSNVTVKNVVHTLEQVKPYRSAYGGFFCVDYCDNVLIRDCGIQCHKDMYFAGPQGQKVLIGSYELLGSHNTNVTYEGVMQNNLFDENGKVISSGLMGTNYCRNTSMINCVVARFDAHCQVHNVTVRGCTMERINIIGFGTALVEDTTIHDHFIFNLRSDYGSMFGGDVVLRRVKMVRENTPRLSVFQGAWVNHNFGYPLLQPRTVTIDDIQIPEGAKLGMYTANYANYEDVTKPVLSDGTENKNAVTVSESFRVVSNPAGTEFCEVGGGIPFPPITFDA